MRSRSRTLTQRARASISRRYLRLGLDFSPAFGVNETAKSNAHAKRSSKYFSALLADFPRTSRSLSKKKRIILINPEILSILIVSKNKNVAQGKVRILAQPRQPRAYQTIPRDYVSGCKLLVLQPMPKLYCRKSFGLLPICKAAIPPLRFS